MAIEIETRFLDINKEDLLVRLNMLGAVDKGETKLDEIIFYDVNLSWLNQNKFIRLRKKNDIVKLTYKSNKEQKVDSAEEIEFGVSDMEETKKFLEATGFVSYRKIEKYRHTFVLDMVTIDIDTWPKIPTYVELEGESVDDLKSLASKLGFVWENRFDGDARYVFKKYGFDFDKIRTVTFDKFE